MPIECKEKLEILKAAVKALKAAKLWDEAKAPNRVCVPVSQESVEVL